MLALQETLPAAYLSPPKDWARLETGTYADPYMLKRADGSPLRRITYAKAHCILQRLGGKGTDDLEHNSLFDQNSQAAEQMSRFAVWTSYLTDVEKAKGGGFNANIITRPEIVIVDGAYKVRGSEKPRKFPACGYFTIRHLRESEDGLPFVTHLSQNMPDEPCSYFSIVEGPERPVYRGTWALPSPGQLDANARWEPFRLDPNIGIRAASDEEPTPVLLAGVEALNRINDISRRYGVGPAEVVGRLAEILDSGS